MAKHSGSDSGAEDEEIPLSSDYESDDDKKTSWEAVVFDGSIKKQVITAAANWEKPLKGFKVSGIIIIPIFYLQLKYYYTKTNKFAITNNISKVIVINTCTIIYLQFV